MQSKEKQNDNNIKPTSIEPNKESKITEKDVIFKENGACEIYTIYILKDGRLVSGDQSCNIIIYNKNNFKSEITKKESAYIMYLTQLKTGELVSLCGNGYINLYNISNNNFLTIQQIKEHKARVHKLREFDNDINNVSRFMACSDDLTINFFFKDKNECKVDYTFTDNIYIVNILRTKEGEIVYSGYNSEGKSFIKFYDIKSRKIINSCQVTQQYNGLTDNLYKMSNTYLLVGASNAILIFDVNQHRQIREIKTENSNCITCVLKWGEKTLLSVDYIGNIKQWIINDDNLILQETKNKAHNGQIRMIRRNQEGLIITCSDDKSIKIWK